MALDLSVVIVNYNVRNLLCTCLKSIAGAAGELEYEVWVVDNASQDNSVEMVQAEFPWVRLIASESNAGYARANNMALRQHITQPDDLPRYVLLLNPDTYLPPASLVKMVEFMDAHPEAGASGPRLLRPNGTLDLACRRSFPTPEISFYRMLGLSRLFPHSRRFARYNLTYIDERAIAEVDSVVGAFMIVRGSLLPEIGLLDESFFMYGEDLDWALRIKKAGWKVMYNGAVDVIHHKGESSRQAKNRARSEFYKAMLIFYYKHYAQSTRFPISWLVVGAIKLQAALERFTLRFSQAKEER
jgi:hypothetical protein